MPTPTAAKKPSIRTPPSSYPLSQSDKKAGGRAANVMNHGGNVMNITTPQSSPKRKDPSSSNGVVQAPQMVDTKTNGINYTTTRSSSPFSGIASPAAGGQQQPLPLSKSCKQNDNRGIGSARNLLHILLLGCLILISLELKRVGQFQLYLQQNILCSYGDLPSSSAQRSEPLVVAADNHETIGGNAAGDLIPNTTMVTTNHGSLIISQETMLSKKKKTTAKSSTTSSSTNNEAEEIIMFPAPKMINSSFVVMVLSRRDAFERRKAIRETWGAGKDNIYFVLGKGCTVPISLRAKDEGGNPICQVAPQPLPNNYMKLTQQQHDMEREIDKLIRQEQEEYSDIIMGTGFVDIYRTLPKKLKTAYTFVHEYLPSIDWVLKVDDDFFVRVDDFETYLKTTFQNPHTKPYCVGRIQRANKAHTGGKWKEVAQFPEHGIYPPFPIGSTGHVLSRPMVDYVSENQHLLFDYQGEDVSVGIWLQQRQQQEGDFAGGEEDDGREDVLFKDAPNMIMNKDCLNNINLVVGHNFNREEMQLCHEWTTTKNIASLTPEQQLVELDNLNQTKFETMINHAKKRYYGGGATTGGDQSSKKKKV